MSHRPPVSRAWRVSVLGVCCSLAACTGMQSKPAPRPVPVAMPTAPVPDRPVPVVATPGETATPRSTKDLASEERDSSEERGSSEEKPAAPPPCTCAAAEPRHKPKPKRRRKHKEPPPSPPPVVATTPPGGVVAAEVRATNVPVMSILGKRVQSPSGEDMGRVVDVLADAGGRVRIAIVDFGGFLGVGNRRIAVDWPLLQFDPSGHDPSLRLSLSMKELRAAPEYKDNPRPQILAEPPSPASSAAPPATRDTAPAPAEGKK
jgi:hypothetical protein